MKEHVVDVAAQSAASPEAIWALLADPTTWSVWGAWSRSEAIPDGSPYRGVGTRRRFRARGITSIEEVTEFAAPSRFGYRLISGMPLRDYAAVVTLTPTADGGTRIRWRSAWTGSLSGLVFRRSLERFIADTARRLAAAAAA
jgi:hypothetical protein